MYETVPVPCMGLTEASLPRHFIPLALQSHNGCLTNQSVGLSVLGNRGCGADLRPELGATPLGKLGNRAYLFTGSL